MNHKMLNNRHHVLMYDDVFEGMYLNIHIIIGAKHCFVIDSGLGETCVRDIDHILEVYGADKPIILVNSHSHWDHVWGNGFINAQWIVAHSVCADILHRDFVNDYRKNIKYARGAVKPNYPNLVFDSVLEFTEDGIIMGYAPGHTDHDIYVYDCVEMILNVGDNIGDTQEECLPYLEMPQDVYRESIKKYQSFNASLVVSGHNEIQDAAIFDRILEALD